jgi:hypothetical protein
MEVPEAEVEPVPDTTGTKPETGPFGRPLNRTKAAINELALLYRETFLSWPKKFLNFSKGKFKFFLSMALKLANYDIRSV